MGQLIHRFCVRLLNLRWNSARTGTRLESGGGGGSARATTRLIHGAWMKWTFIAAIHSDRISVSLFVEGQGRQILPLQLR